MRLLESYALRGATSTSVFNLKTVLKRGSFCVYVMYINIYISIRFIYSYIFLIGFRRNTCNKTFVLLKSS